jgi:predicted dehydrogenase
MTKPLGIGMVGAGMVGQLAHLANFAEIPGCRVVALAELRPELGQSAASRFGVPRLYDSHHALLNDPEVEAVVVVTKRPATGPVVLDCLNAGRHVLSEKPMAHTVAQAERLAAAAKTAGKVYSVGYMKRHDSGTAKAKALYESLVASGELGPVLTVRLHSWCGEFACGTGGFVMTPEPRPDGLESWPTAPDWLPEDRAEDYAWFLNVFCHDLNLLRHLLGATPEPRYVDFGRRNGRLAAFRCGEIPVVMEFGEQQGTAWTEGVEVVFEKGRLTLDFVSPLLRNQPARVTLTRGTETTRFDPGWSWAFKRQAEAFVADIRDGHAPLACGADSVEDLRLAERLWRLALGL